MNKKTFALILALVVLVIAFLAACTPDSPQTTENETVKPVTNTGSGLSMADKIEFQDRVFAGEAYEIKTVDENEMAARIEFHDTLLEGRPAETDEITMDERILFQDGRDAPLAGAATVDTGSPSPMAARIEFHDRLQK